MTRAIATISLAVLTVLNFFMGKRMVLYPPFVYSTIWLLDLIIFAISPITLNEIHSITWWVITLGALLFSIGGWLTRLLSQGVFTVRILQLSHSTASAFGRLILLGICILAIPVMSHQVLTSSGGASASETLLNARRTFVASGNEGNSPGIIVSNLPGFSIAVAVICLIEKADVFFGIALLSSVISCSMTGGRSYHVLLCGALLSALMFRSQRSRLIDLIRLSILPVALFASIFIGLIFLDKDLSGYGGNIGAILSNFVLAYIVTPLPALDYVLTHPSEYAHAAHHTFQFLLAVLGRVGFEIQPAQGYDADIFVPMPTNVYTVYKFFFTDFGLLGMFIVFVIIGFLQTFVYWRAVRGGRVSIFLSAFLLFPAILSIFDDLYSAGGFLLLLKAMLVALMYFGFLNRLRFRTDALLLTPKRLHTDQVER